VTNYAFSMLIPRCGNIGLIKEIETADPVVARSKGYENLNRFHDEQKLQLCREIVEARYKDTSLRHSLLKTAGTHIVYSDGEDNWLGVGNGSGANHFGELLTRYRDTLLQSSTPNEGETVVEFQSPHHLSHLEPLTIRDVEYKSPQHFLNERLAFSQPYCDIVEDKDEYMQRVRKVGQTMPLKKSRELMKDLQRESTREIIMFYTLKGTRYKFNDKNLRAYHVLASLPKTITFQYEDKALLRPQEVGDLLHTIRQDITPPPPLKTISYDKETLEDLLWAVAMFGVWINSNKNPEYQSFRTREMVPAVIRGRETMQLQAVTNLPAVLVADFLDVFYPTTPRRGIPKHST
jgi:hypothetical protein